MKYFSKLTEPRLGGYIDTYLSAGAVRVMVEMLSEEEAEFVNAEGGFALWKVLAEFDGEAVGPD